MSTTAMPRNTSTEATRSTGGRARWWETSGENEVADATAEGDVMAFVPAEGSKLHVADHVTAVVAPGEDDKGRRFPAASHALACLTPVRAARTRPSPRAGDSRWSALRRR